MFWEITIKRTIVLQPSMLHGDFINFSSALLTQLLDEVTNLKCSEDHGYYVTPTAIENVEQGKVRPITGVVAFPIQFKCIVFKPYVKEILDGEVKKVVRRGCFLSSGPLDEIFLHETMMNGCHYYQNESTGACLFKNEQQGFEIKEGTILRFQLIGIRWVEEQRVFKALGSINGDFLGCINEFDCVQ
ncbi:hypothetical protein KP509_06G048400 [Ceratopteris richardii]|uniref:Uncharacterized protein n=1 Tax=Ceratopteris richardii TaxID=49495 RepID=A0A8T2UKK3_CERRI|nr:hypothetical protein KP509_06G048400 [Ceratopteris richardii]KAH7435081.1 hypothetical protein KP509_06G048400 [Ceratopteris richardii]